MAGICKVVLAGNISTDITVKTMTNGEAIANFSIAVNNSSTHTSFFRATVRGDLVKLVEKQKKGNYISLAGELTANTYTANNGEQRISTSVLVREINYIGYNDKGFVNLATVTAIGLLSKREQLSQSPDGRIIGNCIITIEKKYKDTTYTNNFKLIASDDLAKKLSEYEEGTFFGIAGNLIQRTRNENGSTKEFVEIVGKTLYPPYIGRR